MGAQTLDPDILAAIIAELEKQSGVQGFGQSPLVPSSPGNQGPGLAPGAPTPGTVGSIRSPQIPSVRTPRTQTPQRSFSPPDKVSRVTGPIAQNTASIPYLNIVTGIIDAGARIGEAVGGGKSKKRVEREQLLNKASNVNIDAVREIGGQLRNQARSTEDSLTGRGLGGVADGAEGIVRLLQNLMAGQSGGSRGEFPALDSGLAARGQSPIVPTNPDDGIPRDPDLPTPGEGGTDGKKEGKGKSIGSGVARGAGSIGDILSRIGKKETDSQRAANFARAGAANAQGSATNSRALLALMQILLGGGTGRGR